MLLFQTWKSSVKERGFIPIPYLRGNGRGDQYVTVNVVIPKGLTKEQKELLQKFDESMGGEAAKNTGKKKKKFFDND